MVCVRTFRYANLMENVFLQTTNNYTMRMHSWLNLTHAVLLPNYTAILKLLMVSPNEYLLMKWLLFLPLRNPSAWIVRPGKVSMCANLSGRMPCVRVFPGTKISVSVTRDRGRAPSSFSVLVPPRTVTPTGRKVIPT